MFQMANLGLFLAWIIEDGNAIKVIGGRLSTCLSKITFCHSGQLTELVAGDTRLREQGIATRPEPTLHLNKDKRSSLFSDNIDFPETLPMDVTVVRGKNTITLVTKVAGRELLAKFPQSWGEFKAFHTSNIPLKRISGNDPAELRRGVCCS
jgi:hypothetical protein